MEVTLTIPDDLATRLRPVVNDLPRIIELGLRQFRPTSTGFSGLNEVVEALASLPGPEQVLELRASPALQSRVEELLTKNRTEGLSATEQDEWAQYQYAEHLVRLAKAKAAAILATR
ncbi:MAG: hypothetical protein FJ271_24805 [Planctomycetes bacterium]|nr:hypothetical protein [Planctomycetota bacterium]